MTETLAGVSSLEKAAKKAVTPAEAERAAVRELVKAARARGEELTGPDGLLKTITKTVLESALEEEMTEHLGYDKHAVEGRNGGQLAQRHPGQDGADRQRRPGRGRGAAGPGRHVRAGDRARSGSGGCPMWTRWCSRCTRKGLTTGEISAHFAEVYGASVSKDTVSRITDRVVEDMQAWSARPLQPVYAAVFIDAIYVKVRDGQVGNQPFYAAIGVDLDGHRDVLGLWAGARWRGVGEVLDERADRPAEPRRAGRVLRRLRRPEGPAGRVNAVFPAAIVQACIIHLIRGTFRYASKQVLGASWPGTCGRSTPRPPRRPRGRRSRSWRRSGASPTRRSPSCGAPRGSEFIPFLDYDVEIRTGAVLAPTRSSRCNARYRRAVTAKGHFPTEQAALKTLYLVTRSLDPKGTGQARWVTRWKPALNAFAVTFADRMPAAENL